MNERKTAQNSRTGSVGFYLSVIYFLSWLERSTPISISSGFNWISLCTVYFSMYSNSSPPRGLSSRDPFVPTIVRTSYRNSCIETVSPDAKASAV